MLSIGRGISVFTTEKRETDQTMVGASPIISFYLHFFNYHYCQLYICETNHTPTTRRYTQMAPDADRLMFELTDIPVFTCVPHLPHPYTSGLSPMTLSFLPFWDSQNRTVLSQCEWFSHESLTCWKTLKDERWRARAQKMSVMNWRRRQSMNVLQVKCIVSSMDRLAFVENLTF